MDLHLFANNKGGSGNTLFSLCATLYYRNTGKVAILDTNFRNPNLSQIFAHGINDFRRDVSDTPPMQSWTSYISRQIEVMRRKDIKATSCQNIWSDILIASTEVRSRGIQNLIVDTTCSISNLNAHTYDKICDDMLNVGITNVYLWHVWTVSDLISGERSEYFEDMEQLIESMSSTNRLAVEIIHVITPHFAPSDEPSFGEIYHQFRQMINRERTTIFELRGDNTHRLSASQTGTSASIDLEKFRLVLSQLNQQKVLSDIEGIIDQLASLILRNRDRRPRNVFLIPAYNVELREYRGKITTKEMDVDQIINLLSDVYYYIAMYLERM